MNIKRLIFIVVLAFGSFPLQAMASTTITLPTAIYHPGDSVDITGTASTSSVFIKAVRPDSTLLFFDIVNTSGNGAYTDRFTLPSDAALGNYTLVAGEGTNVATHIFQVETQPVTDTTGSTGSTPSSGGIPSVPAAPSSNSGSTNPGGSIPKSNLAVIYNGNGATSGITPIDSSSYAQGVTVSVYGNTGNLAKTGYTFAGWNTQADGNGTNYNAGDKFSIDASNVTLYVKWTAAVKLNPSDSSGGGGGSSSSSSSDTVSSTDGKLTLPVGKSGEVKLGDEVKIVVPADASGKDLQLSVEKVADTQKLLTNNEVLASPVFEILKNFTENFSKEITLTFAFDPNTLKSHLKPSVFYFDEAKRIWVEVGGEVSGNTITVKVNHFTKYAVFALDQATDLMAVTKQTINFSDISGQWAEANIKQAVSVGIVSGYPDGTFKPDRTVTRAEFTVMLMNALKPQGDGASLTFTDRAKIGAWAQKSVAQAVQASIIKGYEDGSFRPEAEITRPEMAAMIAKALGQSSAAAATGFTDDKDIPDWAKGAVADMEKRGIIEGKGANAFAPGDKTTRAEAVTVLLRMLAQKSK